MEEFYNQFHEQVKERINAFGKMYHFGEDSIRYDFYHTAIKYFNLSPSNLILEQAIPPSQFQQKDRDFGKLKQGRHSDKPEFDLRIDQCNHLNQGVIVEFAYFRSTEISMNQDKTGRHGKLMNEIFRLALLKNYTNVNGDLLYNDFSKYKCLLVCVTDSEMINYGNNVRGRQSIPIQEKYRLDDSFISKFPQTARNAIKDIFYNKTKELNIIPIATRVFEKYETPSNETSSKWGIWIWEIDFSINSQRSRTIYSGNHRSG